MAVRAHWRQSLKSGISLTGILTAAGLAGVPAAQIETLRSLSGTLSLTELQAVAKGFLPRKEVIFRAWRRDPRGRKIWARDYGLAAWPIHVPIGSEDRTVQTVPAQPDCETKLKRAVVSIESGKKSA